MRTGEMIRGPRLQAVLILGASPRISVAMARSLHRHGIPVEIASFQPEESDIRSRAVRQFHRLPARRQNPEAFTAALLALVRDKQFDLILPAGDPSLKALADLYDQLGPARVGCPPPRAVERVLNKTLTLETAQRCGIRIPFTCTIATNAELEAIAPQLRFPVVVKPEKKGASAFRVFYFNTLPELSSALSSYDWGSVLLQEYCPGVGVGVEILIHNGECVAKFQHRRLKEAPVTGGVAILAVAEEPDPELLRSSMELLRALEWEGVAMVEFRVDRRTGSHALMEVNGRFWGSVLVSHRGRSRFSALLLATLPWRAAPRARPVCGGHALALEPGLFGSAAKHRVPLGWGPGPEALDLARIAEGSGRLFSVRQRSPVVMVGPIPFLC